VATAFCHLRRGIPLFIALVTIGGAAPHAERGNRSKAVIIECAGSCDEAVAAVRAAGGQVTARYESLKAVAASIPAERMGDLAAAGAASFTRDYVVAVPRSGDAIGPAGEARFAVTSVSEFEITRLSEEEAARLDEFAPAAYNLNNTITGASVLHASDNRGQGIVVAVIDSGSANSPLVPALNGSIIGGESLVPGDPVVSATSRNNDPHGTRVASMIAAHGTFVLRNTAAFVRALQAHAPESVIACPAGLPPLSCPTGSSVVSMVGTAPDAKIYAIKVADSRGGGVPESRLIAAMDRVLTLRRNFNAGMPSVPIAGDGTENNPFVYNSLKIDVVNMSIGGPTLFAGHSIGERLTLDMLQAGIVVVGTAGNNGPAAMTLGSPGTGRGTLAVGAMSSYIHERVLRDVQFGAGSGALLRPFAFNQTASFSSRGPTADGRVSPDVVANGMGAFAQAANGSLDLVSGTSFAAPTVAGAAALLRKHAPWASAVQIRNALIESADATAIADGSSLVDRGRGLIDIPAAVALLNNNDVAESLARGLREERVAKNVRSAGFTPVEFFEGQFSTRVQALLPGQVSHFFVPVPEYTRELLIHVSEIVSESPGEQNAIFGDDLLVQVVDAPTSMGRKHVDAFVDKDSTFLVQAPQPGLIRIAVAGAFSNGAPISGTLTIERRRNPEPDDDTADGRVRQGQSVPIRVNVPAGTAKLDFDLSWRSHWGQFPASDLDLILVNPIGETSTLSPSCDTPAPVPCTLDSPERLTILAPMPGIWKVIVHGFSVNLPLDDSDDEAEERYTLSVYADGRQLGRIR
jgi:subtilisin family serine protease